MLNRKCCRLEKGWKIEGYDMNAGLTARAYAGDYKPSDFVTADVPVVVQNALFQAGKIKDPYVGFNCYDAEWIEKKEWWFINDFDTPQFNSSQRVFLRFEGITYRAEIWINGVQAGRIEGMFRNDDIDVTDFINRDGRRNRISLRIRAQENANDDDSKRSNLNIRTQGPVAQNMYRWNWTPHMVCIGIWRPVSIMLKSTIELDYTRIQTISVDLQGKTGHEAPSADAQLQVEWFIRNSGSSDSEIKLNYDLNGETFRGKCIASGAIRKRLKAGQSTSIKKKLTVKNAMLWWPNGFGKAELHKLTSTIVTGAEEVVERTDNVFGIRKVTYARNEEEDWVLKTTGHTMRPWAMVGEMYKWTLTVNGWRIFMKGSNWVVLDSMLRLESWRYDIQLKLVRDAGMTFLRVWGGSLAETEEFYDLCDRYGIMCWQEFWLACGNYPAMDHDLFIRCVKDTVRRLINRPCLVHYCGGNEYQPDNPENKVLVDKIDAAVRQIDTEREFRRGSPYKGDRHGGLLMTPFATRNKYVDILYGESRIVLMRSEVAVGRSSPMLSSLEKMIPEDRRWPLDDKLWRNFNGVPCEFKIVANEYDAMDDFNYAIYASYLWHARICSFNMEYCRSRMFKCSGNLNWQFSAPWPCLHREIVDTWGVPKPAYYYYMNSMKPTALFVDLEKYLWNPGERMKAGIYAVNDLHAFEGASARIMIFNTDMDVLHNESYPVLIPENHAERIGAIDFPIPADCSGRTLFLKTELFLGDSKIYENLYWFAVSVNPEAEAKIDLSGEWERSDGTSVVLPGNDMNIKNASFEYIILKQKGNSDLENQSGGAGVFDASEHTRYTKKFILPDALKGKDLEFYSPGIEGSDEIFVNGRKIGSHEYRGIKLDAKEWCFVPYGKDNSCSDIDPESEYMFYSDPVSIPKLQTRFYDIPASILQQNGENRIELVLKTYYRQAIAYPMEIRPRTDDVQRKRVTEYLRKGIFYSDLRHMGKAELEVCADSSSVTLKNISGKMAFMVIVEVVPESTKTAMPMNDNAINLMPGEQRTLRPFHDSKFESPAEMRTYGWNIPNMNYKI